MLAPLPSEHFPLSSVLHPNYISSHFEDISPPAYPAGATARPVLTINMISDIVITGKCDEDSTSYIRGLFYAILRPISSEYTLSPQQTDDHKC